MEELHASSPDPSTSPPSFHHPIPEGPQEEQYEQWRSLKTHSPEKLMSVYKEIYFAGFPCRIKQEDGVHQGTSLEHSGGRYYDSNVTCFPQSFVYDFFQKYGTIEQFTYDQERGIGSVTFVDGEAAEGCYLSCHLSLVLPPSGTQDGPGRQSNLTNEDDDEEEENQNSAPSPDGPPGSLSLRSTSSRSQRQWKPPTTRPILIYLEFAQSLAFVNTTLLLHDQLQPSELSRQLLRTYPCVERRYTPHSATHVIFESGAGLDAGTLTTATAGTEAETTLTQATTTTLQAASMEEDEEVREKKEPTAPYKGTEEEVEASESRTVLEAGMDPSDGPRSDPSDSSPHSSSSGSNGSSQPPVSSTQPTQAPSAFVHSIEEGKGGHEIQLSFPCGGPIEVPELQQSLWRVLRPPSSMLQVLSSQESSSSLKRKRLLVTALDVWFEYYWQYVLHKTQPSPDRIQDKSWIFAQRPSVVQEIGQYDPSDPSAKGHGPNPAHRLMSDAAFHQICALLMYKIKFKNDPCWASLMRDIFTPKVQEAVAGYLAKRTYKADLHLMQLQKSLLSTIKRDAGEEGWLQLSLLQAAENAIENIVFLRRVDMGEVDRKTGMDQPPEYLQKLREKHRYRAAELRDPFTLISDFADYLDRYAASGSASGLLAICEDPKTFREQDGHFGFNALHHSNSPWRLLWDIFWVPLLIMVTVASIVLVLH